MGIMKLNNFCKSKILLIFFFYWDWIGGQLQLIILLLGSRKDLKKLNVQLFNDKQGFNFKLDYL